MATTARTANLSSARLTKDGQLVVDNVRFGIRDGIAFAIDRQGNRVWEAAIVDWRRNGRKSITVELADPAGQEVTAISFCRPCKGYR